MKSALAAVRDTGPFTPGPGLDASRAAVTELEMLGRLSASSRSPSGAARRSSSYPPNALERARGHLFLGVLAPRLSPPLLPSLGAGLQRPAHGPATTTSEGGRGYASIGWRAGAPRVPCEGAPRFRAVIAAFRRGCARSMASASLSAQLSRSMSCMAACPVLRCTE